MSACQRLEAVQADADRQGSQQCTHDAILLNGYPVAGCGQRYSTLCQQDCSTLGLRNVTYVVGCAAVELAGVAIQLDSYGVVAGMVRGRRDFFSSELRLIR